MTAQSTTQQRHVKKNDGPGIGELRAKAKDLGINSFGLGKEALAASISAVEGALSGGGAGAAFGVAAAAKSAGEFTNPHGEFEPDELQSATNAATADAPRTDAAGEALGPRGIERVPLGVRRRRLVAEQRPGFYRRWINDVPGRIERAKRAGFTMVQDTQGNPISSPVGTQEQQGGLRAYLMEMPQEFRDQDMAEKRRVNLEIDDALNRGRIGHQAEDRRYVPEQGISIKRA